MKYFYITGTSRGLGKAIAEILLEEENNVVFGISRTCSIRHERYHHFYLDLNDTEAVQTFRFAGHPDAEGVYLVNNSGMLGPVGITGSLNPEEISQTLRVNTIAPFILSNAFAGTNYDCPRFIMNISSGAGRYPIAAWAAYCASKAALDMFTSVMSEERTFSENGPFAISIAPGIIDTYLQEEIRQKPADDFPRHSEFIEYHHKGLLDSPVFAAKKLIQVLLDPGKYRNPVADIRRMD